MSAGGSSGTKKLINQISRCVDDSLEGFVSVHTGLRLLPNQRTVVREDYEKLKHEKKVALVSGGGSGHEPGNAGCVGTGMLTASVQGSIFASPSSSNVLSTILLVGRGNPAGVLLIVLNYTGDVLTFGLALEKAKTEGILVDMVAVGEDCALTNTDKTAGRRGLAGTVLIHKIAGAMAEEGLSLQEIKDKLETVISNLGTMGMAMAPCSLPGSGPLFQLGVSELELGLGIHGEAGVQRMKMKSCQDIVKDMITHMTNPNSSSHLQLNSGDHVAVLINNLGGTSCLEMNIVARDVIKNLEKRGLHPDRVYMGHFVTALDMQGVSISVLKLEEDGWMELLDREASAPNWSPPFLSSSGAARKTPPFINPPPEKGKSSQSDDESIGPKLSKNDAKIVLAILNTICKALIQAESKLNQLDSGSGDGDCGTTLKAGADATLEAIASSSFPADNIYRLLIEMAQISEKAMGGSSGGLYSLFLTSSACVYKEAKAVDIPTWKSAMDAGIKTIMKYGRASVGDRTMLDALVPAYTCLEEHVKAGCDNMSVILREMCKEAQNGVQGTVSMKARAGRASYVHADRVKGADPGATAVYIILNAIKEGYEKSH